jgi:hypothetical protein
LPSPATFKGSFTAPSSAHNHQHVTPRRISHQMKLAPTKIGDRGFDHALATRSCYMPICTNTRTSQYLLQEPVQQSITAASNQTTLYTNVIPVVGPRQPHTWSRSQAEIRRPGLQTIRSTYVPKYLARPSPGVGPRYHLTSNS